MPKIGIDVPFLVNDARKSIQEGKMLNAGNIFFSLAYQYGNVNRNDVCLSGVSLFYGNERIVSDYALESAISFRFAAEQLYSILDNPFSDSPLSESDKAIQLFKAAESYENAANIYRDLGHHVDSDNMRSMASEYFMLIAEQISNGDPYYCAEIHKRAARNFECTMSYYNAGMSYISAAEKFIPCRVQDAYDAYKKAFDCFSQDPSKSAIFTLLSEADKHINYAQKLQHDSQPGAAPYYELACYIFSLCDKHNEAIKASDDALCSQMVCQLCNTSICGEHTDDFSPNHL
jgi:hypothetical protein